MAMELLAFHDQFVADFPPDDQDDNFLSLDIIQGTQVTRPKLELDQRVGPQTLDGFCERRRLVLQPGQDSRFQDALVTNRQRSKLPLGILGDGNLERHGRISHKAQLCPWSWRKRLPASLEGLLRIKAPA
jgi:hypothetical protein